MIFSRGIKSHPVWEQSGQRRIQLLASLGAKRSCPNKMTYPSTMQVTGGESPCPLRHPAPSPLVSSASQCQGKQTCLPPRCAQGLLAEQCAMCLLLHYLILPSPQTYVDNIFAPILQIKTLKQGGDEDFPTIPQLEAHRAKFSSSSILVSWLGNLWRFWLNPHVSTLWLHSWVTGTIENLGQG